MSLLMNYMRKNSNLDKRDGSAMIAMPTSYDVFNMLTASVETFGGGSGSYINGGSVPHVLSFIGKTQSGKTTLALKLAGSIVKPFTNGTIFIRDAERTMQERRMLRLMGWTEEEFVMKGHYQNTGISHDTVYNDIRMISHNKETMKNQILLNTGFKTMRGEPIQIYPPTVYLLDSLPYLALIDDDEEIKETKGNDSWEDKPLKFKDENVLSNTDGMREAGSTKALLKKTADLLTRYNIHFYIVNHITTDVKMNAFAKTPKQMMFLKENEKLPGGASYLHGCFNIVRTEYAAKIDEGEYGPLVTGHMNRLLLVKNKNNVSGIPVNAFFDSERGYNNVITNWDYIFNRRYGFDGSNRYTLKLSGGKSFTKKSLFEDCLKDLVNTGGKELVAPLEYTARRCMYYDLVLKYPDPDSKMWNGPVQKYSYWK